ncbi:hypothetical protein AMECASPLE_004563 [Ameca splendens]|uniref:Uncharacterized protein n=1 Tax=Ameca splendens TaxID=208324 RepID=A0ABV0XBX0_9TELE
MFVLCIFLLTDLTEDREVSGCLSPISPPLLSSLQNRNVPQLQSSQRESAPSCYGFYVVSVSGPNHKDLVFITFQNAVNLTSSVKKHKTDATPNKKKAKKEKPCVQK